MSMTKSACLVLALLVIGQVSIPSAYAMLFTPLKLKDGKTILFAHDCGLPVAESLDKDHAKSDGTKGCDPWEEHVHGPAKISAYKIYPGDSKFLDAVLTSQERSGKPFDEIWLYSYGGNLNEGIGLAKILRQHHTTVRVVKGTECISSCTVAFMGGYFRYIDEGGSYRVHSGSSVMEGAADDPEESPLAGLIADAKHDPDSALKKFAADEQTSARFLARQLQRLFQNTLLIPFATHLPDDDNDFERWAEANRPHLAYGDPDNPQRLADVQRYKTEGAACLQDIAMRIERDSMAQAIADVQAILPSLGKRAGPALDMVSAMYMTGVKETSDLSQETMLKMGYITQDVGIGN